MSSKSKWASKIKEDLEREKLFYEIKQLKGKWWQPSFILAALPTLLAIASLIYVYNSGYFQASTIKLENEKQAIEAKIQSSQELKNQLDAEVKNIEQKKESLKSEINISRKRFRIKVLSVSNKNSLKR